MDGWMDGHWVRMGAVCGLPWYDLASFTDFGCEFPRQKTFGRIFWRLLCGLVCSLITNMTTITFVTIQGVLLIKAAMGSRQTNWIGPLLIGFPLFPYFGVPSVVLLCTNEIWSYEQGSATWLIDRPILCSSGQQTPPSSHWLFISECCHPIEICQL